MKKFITGLLCGVLIAVGVTVAAENGVIRLIINGVDITGDLDVALQIVDGVVVAPVTAVAEALGAVAVFADGEVVISTRPGSVAVQQVFEGDARYDVVFSHAEAWVNNIGRTWAIGIAEVKNTGDVPLFLGSAAFDFEGSDGQLLRSVSSVSPYPQVILPGESAFYFDLSIIEAEFDIESPVSIVAHTDVRVARVSQIHLPVTDVEIVEARTGTRILGRVENNTTDEIRSVRVAALARDTDGNPLAVYTVTVTNLQPGQRIGFEAFESGLPDTITPATIGSVEVFAYPTQSQSR